MTLSVPDVPRIPPNLLESMYIPKTHTHSPKKKKKNEQFRDVLVTVPSHLTPNKSAGDSDPECGMGGTVLKGLYKDL